ncbi:MAG: apolipoprotein N-acyltransferase, partial [Deltaproteobacteria bacterium]|nr:apolipoprotein N-acyltransferase [Deltaproteobacteria bacterium]
YGNINLILSLSALLLLSFYLAFYIALFALIVANFKNNRLSPFWGACIWVALEYARSYIMTGFPWCLLGYSQYSRLPLIQISDIAGVYGISFIIVLVNFALLIGIDAIFTFFLVGCVLVYGYSRLKEKADNNVKGKELRVMIVQGNIDQSLKWDSDFQEETLSIYKKLSLESADFKPQLIIWPETALPFFFQDASHLSKEVFEVARITNANILFGSPAYVKDKDSILYYNRAYMISKSRVFDYYDKVHLVPFGEYVPLKKCIPFVHRLVTAQVLK